MKILFTLFVLLFSFSVYAEWTRVVQGVNGDVLYVDKRTVKIVGNTRYFYYMFDYATPTTYGDLSDKSYREIDCSSMMSRDLIKDYYRFPLGEGNPTDGSGQVTNPKFDYYKPDTIYGIMNKYVCEMQD